MCRILSVDVTKCHPGLASALWQSLAASLAAPSEQYLLLHTGRAAPVSRPCLLRTEAGREGGDRARGAETGRDPPPSHANVPPSPLEAGCDSGSGWALPPSWLFARQALGLAVDLHFAAPCPLRGITSTGRATSSVTFRAPPGPSTSGRRTPSALPRPPLSRGFARSNLWVPSPTSGLFPWL